MALESLSEISPIKTLQDQVYKALRDLIVSGKLESGQFLREHDLSRRIGVSRTPVREALGRLASEGFLERVPQRGYRVPEETLEHLLQLYPIVSALELLAGSESFPRMQSQQLTVLRQINEELKEAMSRNDVPAMVAANNRFHHVLCEACPNQRLASLLDNLRSQVGRLERWYYSYREHTERSIREHESLIAALEAGDYEQALATFKDNWSLTYKAFLREVGSKADSS